MRMLQCVVTMGWVCLAGAAAAEGIKIDNTGGYWFGAETRLRLQVSRCRHRRCAWALPPARRCRCSSTPWPRH